MTDAASLVPLLREELKLQMRHCKLLEAQRRALMACDRVLFCGLQDEYAALLPHLAAQTEARREAMRDAAGNAVTLTALLPHLPERQRAVLAGLRDRLKQTLERAQELCRGNRQLIQNELNYIAFSLDLFVEAGRRDDAAYGGRRWGRRKLLDRCA